MTIIKAEALRYKYPMQDKLALDHLSFAIDKGEFIGIIGENGAGKSTLCQALNGLVPHFHKGAYGGTVTVAGKIVHETSVGELSAIIGMVFENPAVQITGAKLTVYEEIAFGLENLGLPRLTIIERVDEAIELLNLTEVRDRSPFALSGGQMQRVAIAAMIAMRPEIMVFDEPTSQLDPRGAAEVFEAIETLSRNGVTVLVVSHQMERLARHADRIMLMHGGRLVAFDTPERLFTMDFSGISVRRPVYTEIVRTVQKAGGISAETVPVTLEDAAEWLVKHRG